MAASSSTPTSTPAPYRPGADDLLPLLFAALAEPVGSYRRALGEAVRAEILRQNWVAARQRGVADAIVRVR
jgi:hypothetical protein